jgi:hypothetical protein
MKPIFILFALLLLACQESNTPPPTFKQEEQAILSVIKKQTDGWNRGSVDEFMLGYWNSDSLKFITKNGIKNGYNVVSEQYKKSYPSPKEMGMLNFVNLTVTPLDLNNELANVTGNWVVSKDSTQNSGLFSLVLKKMDNHWKIIIDHTW